MAFQDKSNQKVNRWMVTRFRMVFVDFKSFVIFFILFGGSQVVSLYWSSTNFSYCIYVFYIIIYIYIYVYWILISTPLFISCLASFFTNVGTFWFQQTRLVKVYLPCQDWLAMQRSMLEQFAAARGSAEGDNYVEVCSTGPVDSKNGGKRWMCAKFSGTNQPL